MTVPGKLLEQFSSVCYLSLGVYGFPVVSMETSEQVEYYMSAEGV